MSKPRITIIGHVCIDHNTIDGREYRRWGSPAAYIAHYYRLHARIIPDIFAVYGSDFLPFASGLLLATKPTGDETLRYENVFVKSEREWFCRNADTSPMPDVAAALTNKLQASDAVIFAPLLPVANAKNYARKLTSNTRKGAIKAILPQGFMRRVDESGKVWPQEFANALEVLAHFDLAVISSDDHPQAFALGEQWVDHSPNLTVIITEGEKGATVVTHDSRIHVPTIPLRFEDIKNPVGGGDIFSAQVILALCAGRDIVTAVKEAHRTTARVLLGEPLL